MKGAQFYIGQFQIGQEVRYETYFDSRWDIAKRHYAGLEEIADSLCAQKNRIPFYDLSIRRMRNPRSSPLVEPITDEELDALVEMCKARMSYARICVSEGIWVPSHWDVKKVKFRKESSKS